MMLPSRATASPAGQARVRSASRADRGGGRLRRRASRCPSPPPGSRIGLTDLAPQRSPTRRWNTPRAVAAASGRPTTCRGKKGRRSGYRSHSSACGRGTVRSCRPTTTGAAKLICIAQKDPTSTKTTTTAVGRLIRDACICLAGPMVSRFDCRYRPNTALVEADTRVALQALLVRARKANAAEI